MVDIFLSPLTLVCSDSPVLSLCCFQFCRQHHLSQHVTVEAAKVVCALGVIQLLCQLHRAHVSQPLYAQYFAVACTNLLQAPTMAAGLAATDLPSCLLDNVMHYDQSPAVLGPTLEALVYLLRGGGVSRTLWTDYPSLFSLDRASASPPLLSPVTGL